MDLHCNGFSSSFALVGRSVENLESGSFAESYSEMTQKDCTIARIREFDELGFLFDSDDPDARLYMDGFDQLDAYKVQSDEDGLYYVNAAIDKQMLYDPSVDRVYPFRVGQYGVRIKLGGRQFYALIRVIPSHLSEDEWEIMRDEVEGELRGLAADVIFRNAGFDPVTGQMSLKLLYQFFVLQKHYHAVRGALLDIKDRPNYIVRKEYRREPSEKETRTDAVTIRDYLRGAKTRSGMLVPENIVSYDLPENRWVKEILRDYSVRLNEFRDALEGTIRIYRDRLAEYNTYRDTIRVRAVATAIEHFMEYSDMAAQLLKVNAILRFQDWFQTVKPLTNREIPHALTRDPRYSVLYRMYRELHYDTIRLRYGDFYTYGWASTDRMYEMWCYFRLARILTSEAGGFVIKEWISEKIDREILVPELRSGSYVVFEKDDVRIRMYYDAVVSERSVDTSIENPVFTRSTHKRPDGRLDIYVKGEYRKSIVFDCKYRRLRNFYQKANKQSSFSQLLSYKNDFSSPYILKNENFSIRLLRPVSWVWVFYPTHEDFEPVETDDDSGIRLFRMRPGTDDKDVSETIIYDLSH